MKGVIVKVYKGKGDALAHSKCRDLYLIDQIMIVAERV